MSLFSCLDSRRRSRGLAVAVVLTLLSVLVLPAGYADAQTPEPAPEQSEEPTPEESTAEPAPEEPKPEEPAEPAPDEPTVEEPTEEPELEEPTVEESFRGAIVEPAQATTSSFPSRPSFAPGTDPVYVADVLGGFVNDSPFAQAQPAAHWNPFFTALNNGGSGFGDSLELTWSIIPDGTTMPPAGTWDNGNASCTSNLIATFNSVYGAGVWQAELQAVFDEFAAASGNVYTPAVAPNANGTPIDDGAAWPNTGGAAGLRGDVRIGGCNIDGNSNILAYNGFPNNGDMKIDATDSWYTQGHSGPGLRNLYAHEHGHGLGLEHVCPVNATKLMEPLISTQFAGLQHDDLRGVQRLYGDRFELINNDNDAQLAATPLTVNPTAAEANLSLDGTGDVDWFSFDVDAGDLIDVVVTPVGLTYNEGPLVNQSCSGVPGSPLNSLALIDLSIAIYDSAGLLVTEDATAAGAAESVIDLAAATTGTYFARVSGVGTDDAQLYDLSIEAGPGPVVSFSASATAILEGESVTFTDTSTNTPTSWAWTFEGGTPETSTDANPAISYASAGVFEVSLTATNSFGSNTLVETGYITVTAPPTGSVCPVEMVLGDLRAGIAAVDEATGSGYLMWSSVDVHDRFAPAPHFWAADHLVAVKNVGGQWFYDFNSGLKAFVPAADDCLVAAVDFDANTASVLVGTSGVIQGIDSGYAFGDLVVVAEQWNGLPNGGEFGLSGSVVGDAPLAGSVCPVEMVLGDLRAGIAAVDEATGSGYLMWSSVDVHDRFAPAPHFWAADHLVAVKNVGGQWFYDFNSGLKAFVPAADDCLVAAVDFDANTASVLVGTSGVIQGIDSGYASGNLVVFAEQWNGLPNGGEFDLAGTSLTK